MALPILAVALAGSALLGSAFGFFPPLPTFTSRMGYRLWPTASPDLTSLIEMRYRNIISSEEYILKTRELGYNTEWASKIRQSTEMFLGAGELIAAWRRGLINEPILDIYLRSQKFSDDSIDVLKMVTEYFPSPPDLIRFAVREVYSPSIRQKFGMDQDIPPEFITESAKVGLPDDQARNYWASHWELPSPLQGFEMLHRRVIKTDELNMLLRALDVMPFWREKLIQISYNPLTRVDVRRMFDMGVLNEEQVYSSYLDVGYNEENAKLMTEFTKVYTSDESRGITRASVIKAFKRDLLTGAELQSYLKVMGYTDEVIAFWYTSAEYEKFSEGLDEQLDEWVSAYRLGEFDINQLREKMAGLDLPSTFINSLINKEALKISVKRKFPPLASLNKWLEMNIIDEITYTDKMKMLGYKDEDILSYLEELSKETDTSKRKYMTVAVYQRWLKAGIMNESIFIETMTDMEVSAEDIDLAIIEARGGQGAS